MAQHSLLLALYVIAALLTLAEKAPATYASVPDAESAEPRRAGSSVSAENLASFPGRRLSRTGGRVTALSEQDKAPEDTDNTASVSRSLLWAKNGDESRERGGKGPTVGGHLPKLRPSNDSSTYLPRVSGPRLHVHSGSPSGNRQRLEAFAARWRAKREQDEENARNPTDPSQQENGGGLQGTESQQADEREKEREREKMKEENGPKTIRRAARELMSHKHQHGGGEEGERAEGEGVKAAGTWKMRLRRFRLRKGGHRRHMDMAGGESGAERVGRRRRDTERQGREDDASTQMRSVDDSAPGNAAETGGRNMEREEEGSAGGEGDFLGRRNSALKLGFPRFKGPGGLHAVESKQLIETFNGLEAERISGRHDHARHHRKRREGEDDA